MNLKKNKNSIIKIKNKNMKNLIGKVSAGLTIFAVQTATFAKWGVDQTIVAEGSSSAGFKTGVMTVVNYFLGFLGLLAMLMIIMEGISMVTGGEDKREGAQKNIIALVIGLVVIILAYSIVRLVTDVQV